jgi:O-antigen/teichoic acid export membrane protein
LGATARRRIAQGIAAGAFGQCVSIVTQIVMVPMLLRYWGKESYADWLVISTIAAYLGLSDVGMASAGGNRMAILAARDDHAGVNRIFQSLLALLSISSLVVMAACLAIAQGTDMPHLLNLHTLDRGQAATLVMLLGLQVVVGLFDGVTYGIYRAAHLFPRALLGHNVMRCVELAMWCVCVPLGGDVTALAFAMLAVRSLAVGIMYRDGLRRAPFLSVGLSQATIGEIRQLVRPSLAFLCVPIGNALRVQAVTMLGRQFLSTNDFLAFTTVRTLVNSIFTAVTVVNGSLWPEMTRSLAVKDLPAARRLHRAGVGLTMALVVGMGAALAVAGPWILQLWTGGAVAYQPVVYAIQLAAILIYSLWQTSSVVSVSINDFAIIAIGYVASAGLALLAGWWLVRGYGASGLAARALVVDAIMIGIVVPRSMQLTGDSLRLLWADGAARVRMAMGSRT